MKEPRQYEQTLDFSQTLSSTILSVAGSFVAGLETSHPSHQSSPVCARRKLAGFADKSTSVAQPQTQTLYFGTDILGSVRNVTDKYGSVQSNYNYDVFGNPYLSNLDNDMSFGYCGKVYDNGTGLYDYGFRDYSPNQARFTTVDPIRDGSNWFSYVVNDPVNYIDPFGLTSTDSGSGKPTNTNPANNNAPNEPSTGTNDSPSTPADTETPTQPAPTAPAPEAPAPEASAPTVPTPKVYGQVNPNDVKGQFVFFEVSKSAGTMNVYVSRYEDTHQVDIVASIPVVTNVNKDNPDNSNPTDTNRHQGNGTNPTQVPNGIYEVIGARAPYTGNGEFGTGKQGLYVATKQDLMVTAKGIYNNKTKFVKNGTYGKYVVDGDYMVHITPLYFTNGCVGIKYVSNNDKSKQQAIYIQMQLVSLYEEMKQSGNNAYIEYKD